MQIKVVNEIHEGSNGVKGYPLYLNLEGKHCLVFGGGEVAYRKIQALLKRGAKVTCISQEFCGPLKKYVGAALRGRPKNSGQTQLRSAPTLRLKRIEGRQIEINGARLVVAATSDRKFNARVAAACRRKGIWVNVVDDPELCDFYVPAVLERGPLQVAVSTGGASPLFAKRLREALEKVIPASTGKLLEKIGKMRRGRP